MCLCVCVCVSDIKKGTRENDRFEFNNDFFARVSARLRPVTNVSLPQHKMIDH